MNSSTKTNSETQLDDLKLIVELLVRFPATLRVAAQVIAATIQDHGHQDCRACAKLTGSVLEALAAPHNEVR